MESADKTRRQLEIVALVKAAAIGSQEGLRRSLERRGHFVTQATLSRDLRELRIVRVPGEGGYHYAFASEASESRGTTAAGKTQLRAVAALEVTAIEANEMAVIVRTLNGRAQGVAAYIDGLDSPRILGTLAGDDTILVLPRSIKHTARIRADLEELLGPSQHRLASVRRQAR